MKIVHLCDYYEPLIGYQVFFLAKFHQEMGHDVTVITSDRFFPFPDYDHTMAPILGRRIVGTGTSLERGVQTLRLPVWCEVTGNCTLILRGLPGTLARLAPNIVFSHELISPSGYLVARSQKRQGFSLVYDCHAADFNTALLGSWPKRLYMNVYWKLVAPLIRSSATALIGLGRGEAGMISRVLQVPLDSIAFVPLGADADLFRPSADGRNRVRNLLGYATQNLIVVHAGKLTENKDVHLLVEACRNLVGDRPDLRLLVIGNGTPAYMDRLAAAAGPDSGRWYRHHPTVPNEDLPAYLCAADLGVWPGNLSQVIVEGLSCGLPVVLPESGTEHLMANRNGMTFRRGDAAGLERVLSRLLSDRQELSRMGSRSRKLVEETLAWDIIARRFLELARVPLPAQDPR